MFPLSLNSFVSNKERIVSRTVPPGEYWHYGVEKQLQKISNLIEVEEIIIDIGIDGLPLFKSSGQTLWPIIGKFVNLPNLQVILIGTYLGTKKPYNIEQYLHDFVNEIKNLMTYGVNISGKMYSVRIRTFICDAPAKSFVCGTLGHTSLYGCNRCKQIGRKINNVVTYSTKVGAAISDEDFAERKYLNFLKPFFQNEKLPLEIINVKMISQFPLDPMHLIDLGVVKKYLLERSKINPI